MMHYVNSDDDAFILFHLFFYYISRVYVSAIIIYRPSAIRACREVSVFFGAVRADACNVCLSFSDVFLDSPRFMNE